MECKEAWKKTEISLLAEIAIADNGRGVPPENRQLIFEKFQQASTNLTDKPR